MSEGVVRCECGCRRPVAVPAVLRGRPPSYALPRCRKRAYRQRQKHRRSASVEWFTPSEVFDEGLALAGVDAFDLDPCASARSPVWDRVLAHYTAADDGLAQPWRGRVWVNPPYGRVIEKWIAKAIEEVRSGRVAVVCMLVPAKTDTAWWHAALEAGVSATMRRGRIRFLEPQPDGTLVRAGSGRFASAWLIFRLGKRGTKGPRHTSARPKATLAARPSGL